MTDLDLDHLEQLEAAATAGIVEWEDRGTDNNTISLMVPQRICGMVVHPLNLLNTKRNEWDHNGPANRAVIAAARNALPLLVARVRELEAALQPFADAGATMDRDRTGRTGDSYPINPFDPNLVIGDYRRARLALGWDGKLPPPLGGYDDVFDKGNAKGDR